jgi:hypothetical protein
MLNALTPHRRVNCQRSLPCTAPSSKAKVDGTVSPIRAAPTMPERIKMLAPTPILHDPPYLIGDVRQAISLRPSLADYPRRLAEYLEVEEQPVRDYLAALRFEGEVLV